LYDKHDGGDKVGDGYSSFITVNPTHGCEVSAELKTANGCLNALPANSKFTINSF